MYCKYVNILTVRQYVCMYVRIMSLMADGPQRARLPIPRTATLPSCLWSLKTFPSLSGSRLINLYRDVSTALLQLVNQWLDFTDSHSHAFRYGKKNTNYVFHKNRTQDFRISGCTWSPTRPLGRYVAQMVPWGGGGGYKKLNGQSKKRRIDENYVGSV